MITAVKKPRTAHSYQSMGASTADAGAVVNDLWRLVVDVCAVIAASRPKTAPAEAFAIRLASKGPQRRDHAARSKGGSPEVHEERHDRDHERAPRPE